jgi:adenosine kinase
MSFPGRFSEHLLVEQLENISVSFLVDSMRRMRGGVAPNIAYTNALLGGRPTIMASAGRDFGAYRLWLEEQGIDTSAVVSYDDVYCASFFVNTDQDQNQIASFYTGAMAKSVELTFANNAPDAELVIVSPNDPQAMNSYVAECKDRGLAYIYDPSQQTIRLSAEDLRLGVDGCTLLTVNEYELCMIQEKTGLKLDQILAMSGGLLLTMGKKGSRIYVDGQVLEIPAIAPRTLVEPTGAGDAFRGGLLRGLQLGLPWETTGRVGALAATYVLENIGTQGHHYTPQEFVGRYRESFDDQGALDILLT